jgi:hypothetical protein
MTSSWRRVAECVSSAATANGTALRISPPQAPQARSVTIGRIRFPPAETRWRAAPLSFSSASSVARVSCSSSAKRFSGSAGTSARAALARSGRSPRSAVLSSCARMARSFDMLETPAGGAFNVR